MKKQAAPGLLVCCIGIALMLISVFDSRDKAFSAGRPVVFVAGTAFFLAGFAIVAGAVLRGPRKERVAGLAGALALLSLLSVPVLIATHGVFKHRKQAPVFEPVTLSIESQLVVSGSVVRVHFDRPLSMPEGYSYMLCIVPAGAETFSCGSWEYVYAGAQFADVRAPKSLGACEIRLKPHLNAVLSTRPIVVIAPSGTSESPERGPKLLPEDDGR